MVDNYETRQLAAIVFTDLVGFTELMEVDEARAREVLLAQRELIHSAVERFGGKVLKEIGDGQLLMFSSGVNALRCAVAIQEADKDFELRIGVHIGDVVIEGEEVYGSGVNIASRIEPLAPPGGICLTRDVWYQARNQTDLQAISLGSQRLKGIHEPVEVFRLHPAEGDSFSSVSQNSAKPQFARRSASSGLRIRTIGLVAGLAVVMAVAMYFSFDRLAPSPPGEDEPPEETEARPATSIAVLPFENLSPNPEDAYFAGGMHGELISQLSQIAGLRVISRTTMLGYENVRLPVQEIASKLKVGTVLEAEVERVGNRVRIGTRLIDGRTDALMWSENYDGQVQDIHEIRAEVIRTVAEALRTTLSPRHAEALAARPTESPDAYEAYLKGLDAFGRNVRARLLGQMLESFERAVTLDPDFAEAWARISQTHFNFYWFGEDPTETRLSKGREAAEKAYDLAPDLPVARLALANSHYRAREYNSALELIVGLLADTPDMAEATLIAGSIYRRLGRWEESTRLLERTVELDPDNPSMRWNLAINYWAVGRFPDAVEQTEQALALQADIEPDVYGTLGEIHLAWTGDVSAAQEVALRLPDRLANDRALLLAWYDAVEGNYEQALGRLDRVPDEHFMPHLSPVPAALINGVLLDRLHRPEQARMQYEMAVRIMEDIVDAQGFDARTQNPYRSVLAFAYAGLGRDEDAVEAAQRSRDELPLSDDALRGPERVLWLARVHAALGNETQAVETLEELVSTTSLWPSAWLPFDPLLRPLHGHEGFEQLMDAN